MKTRLGCRSGYASCGDDREVVLEVDGACELAALQFKALGHPVRLQIIELLRDQDRRCCGDICSCLPLAQSTISQHLELLCRAGLVSAEPEGNRVHYRLRSASLVALADRVESLSVTGGIDKIELDKV